MLMYDPLRNILRYNENGVEDKYLNRSEAQDIRICRISRLNSVSPHHRLITNDVEQTCGQEHFPQS